MPDETHAYGMAVRELAMWGELGHENLFLHMLVKCGGAYGLTGRPSQYGFHRGPKKECFRNATLAAKAKEDGGWRVMEGMATMKDLPLLVHHAWLINVENGHMCDPTWLADSMDDASYLGVIITPEILTEAMDRTEVYGVLDTGTGLSVEHWQRWFGWTPPEHVAKMLERQREAREDGT